MRYLPVFLDLQAVWSPDRSGELARANCACWCAGARIAGMRLTASMT